MTDDEMIAEVQDHQLPAYSRPGRVLFYAAPELLPRFPWQKYTIEIIDHDADTSLHWLEEGQGIAYWLNGFLELELDGYYVVKDVYGDWWWGEDDDEEWLCGNIRRATEEEIRTEALD
jgi:hypothetical protein